MPRHSPITLDEAAEAADLQPAVLLQLFDQIRARPKLPAPPVPTPERHGDALGDRIVYQTWATRMGLWAPYNGRRLIGYAGLAWLTGRTDQYMRKLQGVKRQGLRRQPEQMPLPVTGGGPVGMPVQIGGKPSPLVLFDRVRTLTWLKQTGRLAGGDPLNIT